MKTHTKSNISGKVLYESFIVTSEQTADNHESPQLPIVTVTGGFLFCANHYRLRQMEGKGLAWDGITTGHASLLCPLPGGAAKGQRGQWSGACSVRQDTSQVR